MKMDEELKRRFSKLSPYERAALHLKETAGRRRESEAAALAPASIYQSFWMEFWEGRIIAVSVYALVQALCWQIESGRRFYEKDLTGMVEAMNAEACWLEALRQIERETGAPLLDVPTMFGVDVRALLDVFGGGRVQGEDYSEQLQTLKELWALMCSSANREDRIRAGAVNLEEELEEECE